MNAIMQQPSPTLRPYLPLKSDTAAAATTPATAKDAIVVKPASERYFSQMVTLLGAVYGHPEEAWSLSTDYFRNQVKYFPEGQFIAVEQATDRVVGLTASMRLAFNPGEPLLDSWYKTTNYG